MKRVKDGRTHVKRSFHALCAQAGAPVVRRRAILEALLAPSPDALASLEQWLRRTHDDLSTLSAKALTQERSWLRIRLALGESDPWFAERLKAIEEALPHAY